MSYIIPTDWKQCVTCARWGGNRHPNDPFCNYVECPSSTEKGKCYGGVFNQADMVAQATCEKWEPQYRK